MENVKYILENYTFTEQTVMLLFCVILPLTLIVIAIRILIKGIKAHKNKDVEKLIAIMSWLFREPRGFSSLSAGEIMERYPIFLMMILTIILGILFCLYLFFSM